MEFFHWNLDTNTKYSANRTVQQMVLLLGISIGYFKVLGRSTSNWGQKQRGTAVRDEERASKRGAAPQMSPMRPPRRTTAADPQYLVGGVSIKRARVDCTTGDKNSSKNDVIVTQILVSDRNIFPKKSMYRYLLDQAHMLVKGICF